LPISYPNIYQQVPINYIVMTILLLAILGLLHI
jgi:hypothetical protein